jgi:hypothetical protein
MGKLCGAFAALVLAMAFAGGAFAQPFETPPGQNKILICHFDVGGGVGHIIEVPAETAGETHLDLHWPPDQNEFADFIVESGAPGDVCGGAADGGVSPGDDGNGDDGTTGNGDAGVLPGDDDGGTTGLGTTGGTGGVAGEQAAGQAGALPFTGLPVWIPALAAVALLASGFALLRRRGQMDV